VGTSSDTEPANWPQNESPKKSLPLGFEHVGKSYHSPDVNQSDVSSHWPVDLLPMIIDLLSHKRKTVVEPRGEKQGEDKGDASGDPVALKSHNEEYGCGDVENKISPALPENHLSHDNFSSLIIEIDDLLDRIGESDPLLHVANRVLPEDLVNRAF